MEDDLLQALIALEEGGTILYPTDTVWGIGCDATNPKAVDKVFQIKQRPVDKIFLILIDSEENLHHYMEAVPSVTWDILKSITTPLTIIYPKAKNLAKNVIAADGSVGIRIAKDEFCKALISRFGRPIVSTSANISNTETPLIFNKISPVIINSVDYVVKTHQDRIIQLKQSSIIKLIGDGEFDVIRK